jgi:hypothetical protein
MKVFMITNQPGVMMYLVLSDANRPHYIVVARAYSDCFGVYICRQKFRLKSSCYLRTWLQLKEGPLSEFMGRCYIKE